MVLFIFSQIWSESLIIISAESLILEVKYNEFHEGIFEGFKITSTSVSTLIFLLAISREL